PDDPSGKLRARKKGDEAFLKRHNIALNITTGGSGETHPGRTPMPSPRDQLRHRTVMQLRCVQARKVQVFFNQ
ncbi:MAG: hypothetical protein EAZ24_12905, partial [Burkholderiales bacterium]